MKQKSLTIFLALFSILSLIITGCIEEKSDIAQEQSETDIALILMDHFNSNTITIAYNTLFTIEIQNLTTPAQLELIWGQLLAQYGEFIEIISTKTTEEQGTIVVYVTCNYADLGLLDTRVVFSDKLVINSSLVFNSYPQMFQINISHQTMQIPIFLQKQMSPSEKEQIGNSPEP